jgi:glycosyltransferase involved in cell wall biosynthesis
MTPAPSAQPRSAGEGVDLTLFVPCLNEEKRVVATLETIRDTLRDYALSYEVLVVDDGSTDGTAGAVEAFIRANPDAPIELHRNPRNLGLSRSFVDAAFRGRGTYFRLVCGDNVDSKRSMKAVLDLLGKADIIVPYYPVLPGKSRFRRLVSRAYTLMVDALSGYRLHYYNGCALYRRYDVMRWAPYNYGFGFQADLITKLLDEKATFLEVPLEGFHLTKDRGGSAVNMRNFLSTSHTLLEIFLRRVRRLFYGN